MASPFTQLVTVFSRACVISALVLGFAAQADFNLERKQIDAIPRGLDARSALEWTQATCKWRIVNNDNSVGMGDARTAVGCFAQARMMMVHVDQNPEIDESVKRAYRNDLVIIFDNHQGTLEACHSLPIKKEYDNFTMRDYSNDITANGGEPSDAFLNLLNQNVRLECLMM